MHTLVNRVVEFEDVLGADAHHLVDRLRETPGWDKRFAILESFVASRIVSVREPSAPVFWAWGQIERQQGALRIGDLAAEIGWSQKHLIRRFREEIGLPPKTLVRVLRFNQSVEALGRDPNPDWAQIALDCGYYDQSHLIRDYREFAGATPTEFITLRSPEGDLSPV
jgi:AraC-like DNA-binding protein